MIVHQSEANATIDLAVEVLQNTGVLVTPLAVYTLIKSWYDTNMDDDAPWAERPAAIDAVAMIDILEHNPHLYSQI